MLLREQFPKPDNGKYVRPVDQYERDGWLTFRRPLAHAKARSRREGWRDRSCAFDPPVAQPDRKPLAHAEARRMTRQRLRSLPARRTVRTGWSAHALRAACSCGGSLNVKRMARQRLPTVSHHLHHPSSRHRHRPRLPRQAFPELLVQASAAPPTRPHRSTAQPSPRTRRRPPQTFREYFVDCCEVLHDEGQGRVKPAAMSVVGCHTFVLHRASGCDGEASRSKRGIHDVCVCVVCVCVCVTPWCSQMRCHKLRGLTSRCENG